MLTWAAKRQQQAIKAAYAVRGRQPLPGTHAAAAVKDARLVELLMSCMVQLIVVRLLCSLAADSQLRRVTYYYRSLSRPLSMLLMLCDAVRQQPPAAAAAANSHVQAVSCTLSLPTLKYLKKAVLTSSRTTGFTWRWLRLCTAL